MASGEKSEKGSPSGRLGSGGTQASLSSEELRKLVQVAFKPKVTGAGVVRRAGTVVKE